jgi:DNA repair protein RecO (recombination protein O)
LHDAYGRARSRLGAAGETLPWTLRRFERDLLAALGLGFDFDTDGDGLAVDPAARYTLVPEHGPRRVLGERDGARRESATGLALQSLAADMLPTRDDLASLRLPLRALLLHYLGGRGLKSWDMMGELGRLAMPRSG